MMQAVRRFTATDFALLKLCCLQIGVLLGIYFRDALLPYAGWIWLLAGLMFGYLCVRIIWHYWSGRSSR